MTPGEEMLAQIDRARMEELRKLLAKHRAYMNEQAQKRALQQARIAAAANGVQPGSTDLVQAAVTDPSVTPQNFSSWLRSKLPSLSVETKEMLVHALGVLFLAALNAAAQNTISRDEAERANQERLNAIFGEVPGVRGLLGGENVLAPCCDDDESVVDAVFAKVERTERKTGGR
jgi:hypothetical protein